MSPFFDSFPKADLDIVAPDGSVRCTARGIVSGNSITIDDTSILIEPRDEIRRKLPNGREEVFVVTEPTYFDGFHGIPAHYQIKITRKGDYPQGTGGHYINVSGHNARVNIGSVDQSSNVVHDGSVFRDLRLALQGITPEQERAALQDAADRMEKAKDSAGRLAAYKAFVSLAADHMAILAPFIPALSLLL